MLRILIYISTCFLALSCVSVRVSEPVSSCSHAAYFDILSGENGQSSKVITISPYSSRRDTFLIEKPMQRIVCMSSSHVAGLSAIGADSLICAVSGIGYISDPDLRARHDSTLKYVAVRNPLYDIGYDSSLDYERLMKLEPDLILAYSVSAAESPFLSRLRSLGLPVLILHDHQEEHPLARAEYVRLYGALTGKSDVADSLYTEVCGRYNEIAASRDGNMEPVDVLMNVPYADVWYIPGGKGYMARLVEDAGGRISGSDDRSASSKVISLEKAYRLSQKADIWLNPGHCRSRDELRRMHHSFSCFGPLANDLPIYNNTLRTTPEGGNDFWESGSVRPDLVLEDLAAIFRGDPEIPGHYFFRLDD